MKFVVKVRSTGSGSIQPLVRGVAKWINSLFLNLTPTSIPNVRRLVSFWSLVAVGGKIAGPETLRVRWRISEELLSDWRGADRWEVTANWWKI